MLSIGPFFYKRISYFKNNFRFQIIMDIVELFGILCGSMLLPEIIPRLIRFMKINIK